MNNGVNGQINWPQLPSKLNEDEIEQINDMEWAEQDPEIKLKYPDEFVAVHRRHVIAHGHNLLEVLSEAQQITGLAKHEIAVTTIPGPNLLQS